MPRTCTVCSHEARRKIDRAIVFGKTKRHIANQFHLTPAAVQRHKQHVAAAIERASEKRELSIGQDILDRLESLYKRGCRLLSSAERTKNHFACIGYLRELRGILAGVFEVSKEVLPAHADKVKVLPDQFVRAINAALGVTGKLEPLRLPPDWNGSKREELPALPQPNEDVIDVSILPQGEAMESAEIEKPRRTRRAKRCTRLHIAAQ